MAEKYYLDKVGLQDVAGHVNTRLKTVTTIPVSADDGAVRLYVGETGATYKKGHIYQYNATDLEWVDITGSTEYTAGNGIDINNGEISVETYIFTGTQAQWDALTTEQKQEYQICNITDDGSADEAIYTKAEIDAMLGTAASKDATDIVRPNDHDLVESNAVYSAINNALSSVYTPRGDLTCAELTSALLIEQNVGNVYQMSDSGTTSALFINGAGKTINVNDNVGIIKAGADTYMFNLMGNAFDLHDYQKKDLTSAIEGQTTVEGALGALSTNKATQAEVNDIVNVLGAKNLLPFNFGHIKKINGGGTWNNNVYTYKDITYTVNADGTTTVNGTATDYSLFRIIDTNSIFLNPSNDYYITGSPSSSTASTYYVYYSELINGSWVYYSNLGNEDTLFTPNASATQVVVDIVVRSGATVNNLVFKPMIRLASDPDNTYVPYSMTNQQITPYVQAISNPNLLDNPWFTVNQRGQSSYTTLTTGAQYTVDRWYLPLNTGATLDVQSDGVLLDYPSYADTYSLMQAIEPDLFSKLKGKTVTISLKGQLISGDAFFVVLWYHNEPNWSGDYFTTTLKNGFDSFTTTIPNDAENLRIVISATDAYKPYKVKLNAIKLELGSVSTLAMDVAPNYASELQRCQRYYVRYDASLSSAANVGFAFAEDTSTLSAQVNLPVFMRSVPTVTFAGLSIWKNSGKAIENITGIRLSGNVVRMALTITGQSTFTAGEVFCVYFSGSSDRYIAFSADL